MATTQVLDDVLELAELERKTWAQISARIAASGTPRCEGDPEPDSDPEKDPDPTPDPEAEPDPEKGEPDWKQLARKHERRAKQTAKENEELKRAAQERENASKSEQEKAIEKAREEARSEALSEAEKERRTDRLEVAVTRLAAKAFADTEDALTNIERAIARGDLDADDIFDDQGKVQTEALKSALEDLLERKPHLAAQQHEGGRRVGSADAGKGAGGKTPADLSVEEHLGQIRRTK